MTHETATHDAVLTLVNDVKGLLAGAVSDCGHSSGLGAGDILSLLSNVVTASSVVSLHE